MLYENDSQIDTQASVLFVLLLLGKRFRFAPAPMILTGVALSALIETFVQFSLMKGTEETYDILRWLAGSTYRVTPDQAVLLMICASVFILNGIAWPHCLYQYCCSTFSKFTRSTNGTHATVFISTIRRNVVTSVRLARPNRYLS
jgi:hypothetical protein